MHQRIRNPIPTPKLLIILLLLGFSPDDETRIFLIGDSTMADKPLIGNPERGWGQVFPLFFRRDVVIANHARNGRSSKSFLVEGRWQSVFEQLRPHDYVFIQFGHNDAKKEDTTRFAEARTDFRNNLLRFVRETRSKDAIPVLLTPVCRRRFDKNGTFVDSHGDYPVVVRELAAEEQIPLIDLHLKSRLVLESLGVEESEQLFLRAQPGMYSAVWSGKGDNTHFNFNGALTVAGLVAEGVKELDLPMKNRLVEVDKKSFVGLGKTVLLDCFYNNEWRKDARGNPVRYHYVWEDTTNSGFSMLGKIISNLGSVIDTLCEAPTAHALKRASIYIIVDPDTPQETEHPNYIDPRAADAVAEWVRQGGALVLMENDKGNAEFERFNLLAGRFGLRFNENSRNKVVGKEYDTGMFDSFPDHPLFKGVKKIFMKEVSTLKVQDPASALLSDKGDVIIASMAVGTGAVFAVGDPWLYNEYMDHRRLPQDFENEKAAENLFRWLLQLAPPSPAN